MNLSGIGRAELEERYRACRAKLLEARVDLAMLREDRAAWLRTAWLLSNDEWSCGADE